VKRDVVVTFMSKQLGDGEVMAANEALEADLAGLRS
jgi:hypothetical protein